MATHTLDPCAAGCGPRRAIRVQSRIGARVTATALVIVAALLMLNGEAWLLSRTSETPDELTVATCAFDAVDPRAGPPEACVTPTMNVDKEAL